jgi:hypothetical protein
MLHQSPFSLEDIQPAMNQDEITEVSMSQQETQSQRLERLQKEGKETFLAPAEKAPYSSTEAAIEGYYGIQRAAPLSNLAELMQPKSLDYYRGLTSGGDAEANLSQDEAAAVLKAHDHGIEAMGTEERRLLNQVISKLKDSIWP